MQEDNFKNPQQSEMPFAIVDGEQVTELPKDLYIPPVALQVFLDAFEGPLDLLLYLIRKQNLNILDIPIADITEQYVDYINLMKELELELAGEYLLMAAMLAEIKSRLLLPIFEEIEEEEVADAEEEYWTEKWYEQGDDFCIPKKKLMTKFNSQRDGFIHTPHSPF